MLSSFVFTLLVFHVVRSERLTTPIPTENSRSTITPTRNNDEPTGSNGRNVSQVQNTYCLNQVSACACNTNKGLLDLSPLDSAANGGKPKFTSVPASDGASYSFNPCSPFTEDPEGCLNVGACQYQGQYDHYFPIGSQDSAAFAYDNTKGLYLQMHSSHDQFIRTSKIYLVCDEIEDGKLEAAGETSHTVYEMTLTSRHACPSGSPAPTTTLAPEPDCDCDFWIVLSLGLIAVLSVSLVLLLIIFLVIILRSAPSEVHKQKTTKPINGKYNSGYMKA